MKEILEAKAAQVPEFREKLKKIQERFGVCGNHL